MPNPIQNLVLPSFDFNLNRFENLFSNTFSSLSNFELPYSFDTYEHSGFKTSGLFSDLCSRLDLSSYFTPIRPTKDPQNHVTKKQSLFGSIRNKINNFAERFISPVTGRITSGYGDRIHPTLHYKKFHNGIDIAVPQGTPVMASASGEVIKVDNLGKGPSGKHVVIRHSSGYTSSYCHLSSTNVTDGQTVSQKDFIGRVGTTGRSTGPHLHFTLKRGNSTENPLNHLHHA